MRTRQYAHKKRASQSFRTPVPRPSEVQSLVQPPPIQAKSNEEGLAEHAERLRKFQRLGNSMIQMGPPRLGNDKASPLQPKPWIQRKLAIGESGDKYEQEADRVASQVVQQISGPYSKENNLRQSIQREKDLQGEMQAKCFRAAIQRKQAIAGGEASPDLESAINSVRGGGQPLDAGLQQSMGQVMGADFSGVRVHTDAQSDQLNQSIQARAFTTGQDVFFREGTYKPGSRGGQELIAHELAHVVQQNGSQLEIQRELVNVPLHKNSRKVKYTSDRYYVDNESKRECVEFDLDDYPYIERDKLSKYKELVTENPSANVKDLYVSSGTEAGVAWTDGQLQVVYISKGKKLVTVVPMAGDAIRLNQNVFPLKRGKMGEENPQHVSSHIKGMTHISPHRHYVYQGQDYIAVLERFLTECEDTAGVLTKEKYSKGGHHKTKESWNAALSKGAEMRQSLGVPGRKDVPEDIPKSTIEEYQSQQAEKNKKKKKSKKKPKKNLKTDE